MRLEFFNLFLSDLWRLQLNFFSFLYGEFVGFWAVNFFNGKIVSIYCEF
jgi:hypothetical protein